MRSILHLRIDAFPVAVERLRDPALRGKPLVICSRHSPRSPIFSASGEAREEGVFEGLPLTKALQRCRGLVVVSPDEKLYRKATRAVSRLLGKHSPLVEPAQWGRFFVDMTGTFRLFGDVQDSAFSMRCEIRDLVRLESTLGVGSNKLVSGVAAKLVASYGDLCTVPLGSESSFLAPLQVRMLPAVQSRIERELLTEFNIRVVQQLATLSEAQLAAVFGKLGVLLHRQALGIDERPVRPPATKPFVLAERTLDEDTNDDTILLGHLYGMIEKTCSRMRARGVLPQTVWFHLRYVDGMDITRRFHLQNPLIADPLLFQVLEPFFLRANVRRQRIRYLSLTFTDLIFSPAQLSLFESSEANKKQKALVSALDKIRSKYGEGVIQMGRTLRRGCEQ